LELAGCSEDGAFSHFLKELLGQVGISLGFLESLNNLLERDLMSVDILRDLFKEHHSLVVEVNLINLLFDSKLDVELLSKMSSSRSMELESSNMIFFASISSDISAFLDLQWNVETMDLEWSHLEVNWYNNIFKNLSSSSFEYTFKGTSRLVWLLCVVLKVNSCDQGFPWGTNQNTWD
jgi:hypothetical protein